jgi:transcription elongation factor Elf1
MRYECASVRGGRIKNRKRMEKKMFTCLLCSEEKEEKELAKGATSQNPSYIWCKGCYNAKQREYRRRNKEQIYG